MDKTPGIMAIIYHLNLLVGQAVIDSYPPSLTLMIMRDRSLRRKASKLEENIWPGKDCSLAG